MRIKLAGFGREGFVQDVAAYDATPEAFDEVRNVRFNSIGAVSFSGHKSVLSPAPIDPLWLRVFPPVDFPRWVYANQQKVYVFDDGHIDISRPGGYNGVLNERWQGEVFSGVGIFNNTVDVPQMWAAFNSATPLEDLANWPANLRTKFLRPFKQFLIAGFLTENGNDHPFRVRWSHPADPGTVPLSWAVDDPAVDSGEFELSETDDYVVDGKTLGEFFMVYKQKTAHAMFLTGNQLIFGQRTIVSGKGALTRDCVQDVKGGHFVAGLDDIYVHSGQRGSEQSVVEATLRKWIFNQIDASNFFNCYTVDYRSENEIWFCFPEAGEIYPTLAFVWNKVTGGRGIREIQRSPFMWSGPVDERTTDGDIWGGDLVEAVGTGSLFMPMPVIEAMIEEEDIPPVATAEVVDFPIEENVDVVVSWTTASSVTGDVTDYEIYGIDSQTLDGAPVFPDYPTKLECVLLDTVDAGTLEWRHLGSIPLLTQYGYYVKALTTTTPIDSEVVLSQAPT